MVTIGGLPVFDALVTDEDTGMLKISLVDAPAVMTDFVAFADQRPVQMYAVEDEEKRLVFGVVMRADFPIYRRDERLGEYYVVYKPDTIRRMAEKYLADGLQNETSTMHQTDVDRVQMVQWFIKDEARGVVPQGFDVPDGSLFAEFHVLNDEVWAAVKDGTYKGKFNNPGWKSFPFILRWVEIKPVIPRPDSKGRIPSPKSLAYLIVRKRNLVGDPGTHGFEKARDAILPTYYERIKEALTQDIGNYLLTVFAL